MGEEEATQETSTQVQETKPNAQAETEHVPECLESSNVLNDTSDAKTVTGSEKSSPDAEKVKADAEKSKEETAAIAAEEPTTQNKAPEQAAPTDHDYEDVTPLNSVADESVVAPLEEKPQPTVPQPAYKTPEPPQSDTVTVPEAAVEGKPEEASTPAATTDVPPVVSPRHNRNRDSFVETKEEIVDDLE